MPTTPNPHTPRSRDRALARLRRLTIGSIAGSVLALGGFATAAAVSYSGSTAAKARTTPSRASTTAPTTGPTTDATPGVQTPVSTPTATPVPTPTPATSQPSATTGPS